MQLSFVKKTQIQIYEKVFQDVLDQIVKRLKRNINLKNKSRLLRQELIIVFVSGPQMRKLNHQFRNKNFITDILSFAPSDNGSLGELVLCPIVLKQQALQNGHSIDYEILYMLIHGVLHLLGYDHEGTLAEEKKMFLLQDRLFSQLTAGKINLKLTVCQS